MSDRLIEQLKSAKQHVTLAPDRKAAVRAHLLQAIDGRVRARTAMHATPARFFFTPMRTAVMFAIIVLLVGSTGVSFAAQNAVPGDALYPIKINVNEKVQTALAVTAETKAQVAIAHAENRLDEAATLSENGKLDADTATQLQSNFESASDVAEANIATLEDNGNVQAAANVAVRFEGSLKARHAILAINTSAAVNADANVLPVAPEAATLSATTEPTSITDIHAQLATAITSRIASLMTLREGFTTSIAEDTSIGQEAAARAQVDAAVKAAAASASLAVDKTSDQNDDQSSSVVSVQARAAQQLATDAQTKFDAGSYSEAFTLGSAAVGTAEEAHVLAKQDGRLTLRASNDRARRGKSGGVSATTTTSTATTSTSTVEPKPAATPIILQGTPATAPTPLSAQGSATVNADANAQATSTPPSFFHLLDF